MNILHKMKYAIVFIFIFYGLPKTDATYTTKYDNLDLDEILASDRLLTSYIKCLMDQGPCTADGKELKNNLPDAIQNDCNNCTDKQKVGADKVMNYLIDNKPEEWDKLEEKYHSDGTYKKKYLENKNAKNVNVTRIH